MGTILRENTPIQNLTACRKPWAHADANHPQPSAFLSVFGKIRKLVDASRSRYGSGGGIHDKEIIT
jgi:hypothetical protein